MNTLYKVNSFIKHIDRIITMIKYNFMEIIFNKKRRKRNVDFAFVLSITQSVTRNENGQTEHVDRWLSFKTIAFRFETADFNYTKIRFATGNNLRLVEDINEDRPMSTLGDNVETTKNPMIRRANK